MESKLLNKLEEELESFKQEVKEKGIDYAIDKAYELTVKQEIIDSLLYDNNLSNQEQKALLSCKKPLQKIYDDWLTQDGNLRNDINFSVDKSINSLTSAYIKKVKLAKENAR